MDKQSEDVRKYLASRCDLIGAVRLPNTAFKALAGTEVTADILFLQKRDHIVDQDVSGCTGTNADGIPMNQYFIDHPEMICGKMEMVSGPYGCGLPVSLIPVLRWRSSCRLRWGD